MKRILLILIIVVLMAGLVSAIDITISPSKDTGVDEGNPTYNYGSCSFLILEESYVGGFRSWVYLNFDISDIPNNARIDTAKLYVWLYRNYLDASEEGYNVSTYLINEGWAEGSVCNRAGSISWNDQPDTGTIPSDSIKFFGGAGEQTSQWMIWDVKSLLETKLPLDNDFGIAMKTHSGFGAFAGDILYFYSRQSSSESSRPYLDITYTTQVIPSITTTLEEHHGFSDGYVDNDGNLSLEPNLDYLSAEHTAIDSVLVNATLYHNITGWKANQTISLSTTSDVSFFELFNISDGTYVWNVKACNDETNCSFADDNWTFTVAKPVAVIDHTAPIVTLNSPSDGYWNNTGDMTFQYTPTDNCTTENCYANCQLFLDDILYGTNTSIENGSLNNFSVTNLVDGIYSWNVNCTDFGDNVGTGTERTLYIDTGDPTVSLFRPKDNNLTASTTTDFRWYIVDDMANRFNCSLYIDNLYNLSKYVNTGYTPYYPVTVSEEGSHDWNVTCEDNATNTDTSPTRSFVVDTSKPTIKLESPANDTYRIDSSQFSLNLNYNVSDTYTEITDCRLYINNSLNQTDYSITEDTTQSFSVTFGTGVYLWSVNCTDQVSNVGYSGYFNLTLEVDTTPPDTVIGLDNVSVSTTEITINWTNPSNNDFNKSIIYRNGTNIINVSVSLSANHNYTDTTNIQQGYLYNYTVFTEDHYGNLNDTYILNTNAKLITVPLEDSTPPVITISSPSNETDFLYDTTSVEVIITTDENANCRYNDSDVAYSSMTDFDNTGDRTIHSTEFSVTHSTAYTYYYRCTDTATPSNANTASAVHSFTVFTTTPPMIALVHPQDAHSISLGEDINFTYVPDDDNDKVENCSLYTNRTGNWGKDADSIPYIDKSVEEEQNNVFQLVELGGGSFIWNVECYDDMGLSAFNETNLSFTVSDTIVPIITIATPANETELDYDTIAIEIGITTNELATCKYDTSDVAYASMANDFLTSDNSNHNESITVSYGNTYDYYYRCSDFTGNANTVSVNHQFSVEDNVAPVITLINPPDGTTIPTTELYTVQVKYGVSDDHGSLGECKHYTNTSGSWVEYSNKTGSTGDNTFSIYNLDDGTYRWNVICYDDFGLSSWGASDFTFTIDRTVAITTRFVFRNKDVEELFIIESDGDWFFPSGDGLVEGHIYADGVWAPEGSIGDLHLFGESDKELLVAMVFDRIETNRGGCSGISIVGKYQLDYDSYYYIEIDTSIGDEIGAARFRYSDDGTSDWDGEGIYTSSTYIDLNNNLKVAWDRCDGDDFVDGDTYEFIAIADPEETLRIDTNESGMPKISSLADWNITGNMAVVGEVDVTGNLSVSDLTVLRNVSATSYNDPKAGVIMTAESGNLTFYSPSNVMEWYLDSDIAMRLSKSSFVLEVFTADLSVYGDLDLIHYGFCYQETANVSTFCGGLGTGSYSFMGAFALDAPAEHAIDGDWTSFSDGSFNSEVNVSINYTKPNNALNTSLWQGRNGISGTSNQTFNLTIPTNCWNQNPLQFKIISSNIELPLLSTNWTCYDGATWDNLLSIDDDNRIYEEAMWWDMTTGNIEILGDLKVGNGTVYVKADGNINASQNITALNYFGDGSELTGISAGFANPSTEDLNMSNKNIRNASNIYLGTADEDHYLYFYEDNSPTTEYLKWSNGGDLFEFSDALNVLDRVYSSQYIYANSNIYSLNGNIWVGSSSQNTALFHANATGNVLTKDIHAKGNITTDGNYFGDGSQLTGVSAGFVNPAVEDLNMSNNPIRNTSNLYLGTDNANHYIYFYDGTSPTGQYLGWLDGSNYFYVSTKIKATTFQSSGTIYAGSDIYTTGTGDDLWLGTSTQNNAKFQANSTGNVLARDIHATGNITASNVFTPQYIFSHTNETIPVEGANLWTNITFSQEDSDINMGISHTYNDATNHTFTIMEDGIYNIDYDLDVEDTSVSASDIDVAARLVLLDGTEVQGSIFEIDITKQGTETELSHNFLASCNAGDQFIFQFVATDADVEISTHGTFGEHPESATVLMNKIANIP